MNKSVGRLDEKLELVSFDQKEVTHKAQVSVVKELGVVTGVLGEKIDVCHKSNTKVGILAGATNMDSPPGRLLK